MILSRFLTFTFHPSEIVPDGMVYSVGAVMERQTSFFVGLN